MNAIILAGGYGTRLRPLTNRTPKCLVKIGGRPLLDRWLSTLSKSGIRSFLINTHYLSEEIVKFIESSKYAGCVTLTYEPHLLGTNGTLIANRGFFEGQDGLLLHADNYSEANISALLHAHANRTSGCSMTMLTFASTQPESCGIVETDSQGVLVGFHEKVPDPPGCVANSAIYVLSKELIQNGPIGADFSEHVIPRLLGRIQTHFSREFIIDIGTPDNYALAASRAKLSYGH